MSVATAPPSPASGSRWRAGPARLLRLLIGLWIFGVGEALLVGAALGNSPWTVLAQGMSVQTGLGVGTATIVISFVVLALWVPLRQRPGLGTLLNAVVIGLAIAATLPLLPEDLGTAVRVGMMVAGIALVAVGSGLYLTCRLGPGPRDGLMTGLHRRTGRSVRVVRAGIELSVLAAGFLLGGTVGIGTAAFALSIGPGVQAALAVLGDGRTDDL
jgi:uncharacterized membrane protein YczE